MRPASTVESVLLSIGIKLKNTQLKGTMNSTNAIRHAQDRAYEESLQEDRRRSDIEQANLMQQVIRMSYYESLYSKYEEDNTKKDLTLRINFVNRASSMLQCQMHSNHTYETLLSVIYNHLRDVPVLALNFAGKQFTEDDHKHRTMKELGLESQCSLRAFLV